MPNIQSCTQMYTQSYLLCSSALSFRMHARSLSLSLLFFVFPCSFINFFSIFLIFFVSFVRPCVTMITCIRKKCNHITWSCNDTILPIWSYVWVFRFDCMCVGLFSATLFMNLFFLHQMKPQIHSIFATVMSILTLYSCIPNHLLQIKTQCDSQDKTQYTRDWKRFASEQRSKFMLKMCEIAIFVDTHFCGFKMIAPLSLCLFNIKWIGQLVLSLSEIFNGFLHPSLVYQLAAWFIWKLKLLLVMWHFKFLLYVLMKEKKKTKKSRREKGAKCNALCEFCSFDTCSFSPMHSVLRSVIRICDCVHIVWMYERTYEKM